MSADTKVCTKCHEEKPLAAFHKSLQGRLGLTATCKACVATWAKEYRLRDPKAHKRRAKVAKRRHILKKHFGLSEERYNKLFKEQNGVCAICGEPETTTSGSCRTPRTMAVDHDHKTGEVRGLLCNRCNPALGLMRDNVALLTKAIAYLERSKNTVSGGGD